MTSTLNSGNLFDGGHVRDAVGEILKWVYVDWVRIRVSFVVLEPCPSDKWRHAARTAAALLDPLDPALACCANEPKQLTLETNCVVSEEPPYPYKDWNAYFNDVDKTERSVTLSLLTGFILFGTGVSVAGALGLLLSMLGGGIIGLAIFA